jgi:hypothetical protein
LRFAHILFANIFKVLVSFLYLFYNTILTYLVVSDEMMRFPPEDGNTALRASSLSNDLQRFSFFLSLPSLFAIPQIIAFTLLHWLVPQSICIVLSSAYRIAPKKERMPSTDATRLGSSCAGIFLVLMTAIVLITALLNISSTKSGCKAPKDFPRMATDSAAIDAVCRPAREDTEVHLFPIRLGAVTDGVNASNYGRIAFSSDTGIKVPEGGFGYEVGRCTMRDTRELSRSRDSNIDIPCEHVSQEMRVQENGYIQFKHGCCH